jgi:hypothetical protein
LLLAGFDSIVTLIAVPFGKGPKGAMPAYTIGRSHLPELYHSELESGQVGIVDGPIR